MKPDKKETAFQDLEEAKKLKHHELLQNRVHYRAALIYSFSYTRLLYSACIFFASLAIFVFSIIIGSAFSAGFSFMSMLMCLFVLYFSNAWLIQDAILEHDNNVAPLYSSRFIDMNLIAWFSASLLYLLYVRM